MNVYDMDGYTLNLLYEDVSDANRTEYAPLFLRSYNRAYGELQRTRYRPSMWEDVSVVSHAFALSDLSHECAGIIKVSQYQDFTEDAGFIASPPLLFIMRDAGTVVLPHYGGDAAHVHYYCRYPALKNNTPTVEPEESDEENTPQIPEEAHVLLCLLAAADSCRRRRRIDLADAHMREYYRVLGTIQPYDPNNPVRQMRNLFGNFNGWK